MSSRRKRENKRWKWKNKCFLENWEQIEKTENNFPENGKQTVFVEDGGKTEKNKHFFKTKLPVDSLSFS